MRFSFPSPYGDFVFQHRTKNRRVMMRLVTFPSPYGDFVFQPAERMNCIAACARWFPSPYGDFVFQHNCNFHNNHSFHIVSVPLRGFCFSTTALASAISAALNDVSVPLRGFCFSTQIRKALYIMGCMFPSPYGDFVFQRSSVLRSILRSFSWFPSPYGDFVFQRCASVPGSS